MKQLTWLRHVTVVIPNQKKGKKTHAYGGILYHTLCMDQHIPPCFFLPKVIFSQGNQALLLCFYIFS